MDTIAFKLTIIEASECADLNFPHADLAVFRGAIFKQAILKKKESLYENIVFYKSRAQTL